MVRTRQKPEEIVAKLRLVDAFDAGAERRRRNQNRI
jgi:hypothetical protein